MSHYQVIQLNGRTDFRPTRGFALSLAGLLASGAMFCAALAAFFLLIDAGEWPALLVGGAFCLGALTLTFVAFSAWRTRNTPLTVGQDEGVAYGARKLCAGNEVLYVAIIPAKGGELGDCEVVLGLAGDRQVEIPSQYFGSYRSPRLAQPFAEQLAHALAVPIRKLV